MKQFDVCGIGNALVDMEFEVDDEFIIRHNIDKGLMTLVDDERQAALMNDINHEETAMKSGGSAANSMIAVSQFGGKSYYSCKVSNDHFGDFYLNDLKNSGVTSNLTPEITEPGVTGKCLVMITPDAERTMNTYLGITSNFSIKELDEESIKNSTYLYIEGYLVASPTAYEAMIEAREIAKSNNVKTSLTFSDPNMVSFFKEKMAAVVGEGLDLIFCNEEEAKTFTGKSDLLEAREELKNHAKNFVITLGRNGAMIFDGETYVDIEPYPVAAVDTNGAGDMFAGAFLYGVTNGHSLAQAGKLASLAASKIVSQFGPRLKADQAKQILEHLAQ